MGRGKNLSKLTYGYVCQEFVGGKCVRQEFVAGSPVEWENEVGQRVGVPEHEDQPFEMVQPKDR